MRRRRDCGADFHYRVTRYTMVQEQMTRFFNGFRRDAHPMSVMVACVGALAAFYHDSTDINDPWQREVASIRIAQLVGIEEPIAARQESRRHKAKTATGPISRQRIGGRPPRRVWERG